MGSLTCLASLRGLRKNSPGNPGNPGYSGNSGNPATPERPVIDLNRATATIGLVLFLAARAGAQQAPQPAGQPAPQTPAAPAVPPVASTPVPGTVTCPAPAPPAKLPDRIFNAPVGVLMQPVIATRVEDYEKFLGYVREAIASSTDKTVQQQAKGWRFYKMAEPGPNNDVIFVFVLDPTVTCVDYAFGPILAAAVPDAAKLSEIWALFKGSVRQGPTLMNLVPVTPPGDSK